MTDKRDGGAVQTIHRWGALWYSRSKRDGVTTHIMFEGCQPALFQTRREARVWINMKYGYIKSRPDLRIEPHGWRMPKAVKVRVEIYYDQT